MNELFEYLVYGILFWIVSFELRGWANLITRPAVGPPGPCGPPGPPGPQGVMGPRG